jgi:hypothetical protein
MSISVATGTATGTASLAFDCRAEVCLLSFNNHSGDPLFIGGAEVTTSNGYRIASGAIEQITIYNGDKLYVVSQGASRAYDILHTQPNP